MGAEEEKKAKVFFGSNYVVKEFWRIKDAGLCQKKRLKCIFEGAKREKERERIKWEEAKAITGWSSSCYYGLARKNK